METLLRKAMEVAPQSGRARVELGRHWARQGRALEALAMWQGLLRLPDAPVALVAADVVQLVQAAGAEPSTPGAPSTPSGLRRDVRGPALELLQEAYRSRPSLGVLQAINTLAPAGAAEALQAHLAREPSLSAAAAVLALPPALWHESSLSSVQQAVDRSSRPLQRYRCAACGFEAQRYFWQCPGCLSWDSYPVQRIEEF